MEVRHMATVGSSAPITSRDRYAADDNAYGWVLFAGTMIAIVGTLNFIYGIAGISNSKFYARGVEYVISDLKTWGWVMLCIGVIQIIAAFSIWAQASFGRVVGVASAGLNAIIQLIVVSGAPFLSLALFSIDILVIYALIAHGGRPASARR
jgi:hypothetical protein